MLTTSGSVADAGIETNTLTQIAWGLSTGCLFKGATFVCLSRGLCEIGKAIRPDGWPPLRHRLLIRGVNEPAYVPIITETIMKMMDTSHIEDTGMITWEGLCMYFYYSSLPPYPLLIYFLIHSTVLVSIPLRQVLLFAVCQKTGNSRSGG